MLLTGLMVLCSLLTAQGIVIKDSGSSCRFPEYMFIGTQSWQNSPVFEDEMNVEDIKEVWHIFRNGTSMTIRQFDRKLAASFGHGTAFDTSKTPMGEYHLLCHSNPKRDRNYVIVQRAQGQLISYQCFHFVKRSEVIISLSKTAEVSAPDDNLCDSAFFTSPSPLLYFQEDHGYYQQLWKVLKGKPYYPCPLKGAFVVESIFSTLANKECSGTYLGDNFSFTEIENECEKGTGMTIPLPTFDTGGSMSCSLFTGHFYCMASWRADDHTYMIMSRPYDLDRGTLFCAKYLGHSGLPEDNMIYLYNNSFCADDNNDLNWNYIKYNVKKLDRQGVGLCDDIDGKCQQLNPDECSRSDEVNYLCAHTCKYCPKSRWWTGAVIDQKFQGTFKRDSFVRGAEDVEITEKHIYIPTMGRRYEIISEDFCPYSGKVKGNVTTYLLLQRGDDSGCMPFLSVIAISEITPSLLIYKISQGKQSNYFPFPNTEEDKQEFIDLCPIFYFHVKDYVPLHNVFHHEGTSWDILVRDKPMPYQVPSAFLLNTKLTVTLHDGNKCLVKLNGEHTNTSIELTVESCNADANQNRPSAPTTYQFVAPVFEGDVANLLRVVVRSQGESELSSLEYLCWIIEEETGVGFWMPIGNCNYKPSTVRTDNGLRPLAIFIPYNSGPSLKNISYMTALGILVTCLSHQLY